MPQHAETDQDYATSPLLTRADLLREFHVSKEAEAKYRRDPDEAGTEALTRDDEGVDE